MSKQLKTHGRRFLAVALSILMMLPFMAGFTAFVPEAEAVSVPSGVPTWDGTIPSSAPSSFRKVATDTEGKYKYYIDDLPAFIWFFKTIADGTTYASQTIYFNTSVNLNNIDFTSVWPDSANTKQFRGSIWGRQAVVYNFRMVSNQSNNVGLFRYVGSGAAFHQFTLNGSVVSSLMNGHGVGALIGHIAPKASVTIDAITVRNCSLHGAAELGFLVGADESNTLTIKNTVVEINNTIECGPVSIGGTVSARYVGGFVGSGIRGARNDAITITISNSTNNASIVCKTMNGDTTAIAGGIYGAVDSPKSSTSSTNTVTIRLDEVINTGSVTVNAPSSGSANDFFAGGLFGMVGTSSSSTAKHTNIWTTACQNTGAITAPTAAAGMFGGTLTDVDTYLYGCVNKGNVTATTDYGYAGGLICYAYHNVTIDECVNTGTVSSGGWTGGLLAGAVDGFVKIARSANMGDVYSLDDSTAQGIKGGLVAVGFVVAGSFIRDSFNWGAVVNGEVNAGILGIFSSDVASQCTIKNCYNVGTVYDLSGTTPVYGYAIYDNSSSTIGGSNNYSLNNNVNKGSATRKTADWLCSNYATISPSLTQNQASYGIQNGMPNPSDPTKRYPVHMWYVYGYLNKAKYEDRLQMYAASWDVQMRYRNEITYWISNSAGTGSEFYGGTAGSTFSHFNYLPMSRTQSGNVYQDTYQKGSGLHASVVKQRFDVSKITDSSDITLLTINYYPLVNTSAGKAFSNIQLLEYSDAAPAFDPTGTHSSVQVSKSIRINGVLVPLVIPYTLTGDYAGYVEATNLASNTDIFVLKSAAQANNNYSGSTHTMKLIGRKPPVDETVKLRLVFYAGDDAYTEGSNTIQYVQYAWTDIELTGWCSHNDNNDLQYVAAVNGANCITRGTVAHYHCPHCDKDFADANATTEITDLTANGPYGDHNYVLYSYMPTYYDRFNDTYHNGEDTYKCTYDSTHIKNVTLYPANYNQVDPEDPDKPIFKPVYDEIFAIPLDADWTPEAKAALLELRHATDDHDNMFCYEYESTEQDELDADVAALKAMLDDFKAAYMDGDQPGPGGLNKYVVTWKNWDGATLRTDNNVVSGTVPSYGAADPERVETDVTYTFFGWTDGTNNYAKTDTLPNVTADVTYTALFNNPTATLYTITWVNAGEPYTTQVGYGNYPSHNLPSKADDTYYTYSYDWDTPLVAVTADTTYTAVETRDWNAAKQAIINAARDIVTNRRNEFTDEYLGLLEAQLAIIDSASATDAEKEAAVDELERLLGVTVQSDYVAYLITYNKQPVVGAVELIETLKIKAGDPSDHALPTKADDTYYKYAYAWNKPFATVTAADTYTAIESRTWNDAKQAIIDTARYIVTNRRDEFADEYLGLLEAQLAIIDSATATDAQKEAAVDELERLLGATVQPGYVAYLITYNKQLVDGTVELIETLKIKTGDPSDHTLPTKANDSYYAYAYAWDKPFAAVTGPDTYTAVESRTWNADVLALIAQAQTLVDEQADDYDGEYIYNITTQLDIFNGEYTAAEKEAAVDALRALLSEEGKAANLLYTVTFNNSDGSLYKEYRRKLNTVLTDVGEPLCPQNTVAIKYPFLHWTDGTNTYTNATLPAVAGAATYTAVYDMEHSVPQRYTVTFVTDGTPVSAITEDYNTAVSLPASEKTGYTFVNWCTDEERTVAVTLNGDGKYVILGDVTLYAKFTEKLIDPGDDLERITGSADGTLPQGICYTADTLAAYNSAKEAVLAFNGLQATAANVADYNAAVAALQTAFNALVVSHDYSGTLIITTYPAYDPTVEPDGAYTNGEGDYKCERNDLHDHSESVVVSPADYTKADGYKSVYDDIKAIPADADWNEAASAALAALNADLEAISKNYTNSEADQAALDAAVAALRIKYNNFKNTYMGGGTEPGEPGLNKYTVIWKNYNEAELEKDENVVSGTTASYDGETPAKPSDYNYCYVFSGWTEAESGDHIYQLNQPLPSVTRNMTFTAVFTAAIRTDADYTEYNAAKTAAETVRDMTGILPAIATEIQGIIDTAVAMAHDSEGRNFRSDDADGVQAIADATALLNGVVSTYTDGNGNLKDDYKIHYTITWLWEDGITTIDTTSVAHGNLPTHAAPVKADDALYAYEFTNWNPAPVAATADSSYSAVFSKGYKETVQGLIDWASDIVDNHTSEYDSTFISDLQAQLPILDDTDGTVSTDEEKIAAVTALQDLYDHANDHRLVLDEYVAYDTALGTLTGLLADENIDPTVKSGIEAQLPGIAETIVDGSGNRFVKPGTTEEIQAVIDATAALQAFIDELDSDHNGKIDDGKKQQITIHWAWNDGSDTTTVPKGNLPTHAAAADYTTTLYAYTFDTWTPDIVAAVAETTYTAAYAKAYNSTVLDLIEQAGDIVDNHRNDYDEDFISDLEAALAVLDDTDGTVSTDAEKETAVTALQTLLGEADSHKLDLDEYAAYDTALATLTALLADENIDPTVKTEIEAQLPDIAATVVDGSGNRFVKPGTAEEIQAVVDATATLQAFIDSLDADHDGQLDDGKKQQFTITWTWNSEGIDNIDTTTVAKGNMPAHAAVTKADDDYYTYEFSRWTPDIVAAEANTTYTAEFSKDWNETVQDIIDTAEDIVDNHSDEYGDDYIDDIEELLDIINDDDATDEEKQEAIDDLAELISEENQNQNKYYTITWVNAGEPLTTSVLYGDMPAHDLPAKADDDYYTYSYAWNPALAAVTGEATYTAVESRAWNETVQDIIDTAEDIVDNHADEYDDDYIDEIEDLLDIINDDDATDEEKQEAIDDLAELIDEASENRLVLDEYVNYDKALNKLNALLNDPSIDPAVKASYESQRDAIAATVVDAEGNRFLKPGTDAEIQAVLDATAALNALIGQLDANNDGQLDDEFKRDLDEYEDYDEALETLTELLSDPAIDPEVKDHYQDLIDAIAETVVDDEGERFKEPGTEEEIQAVIDATEDLNDLIAELDKDHDGKLDDEFKKDLDAYEDYDDAHDTLTDLLSDPAIDPAVKAEIEAEIAAIDATVVDEEGERFKVTGDEAVDAANTAIVEAGTAALQEIIDRLDSDGDGKLDDEFKRDLDEYEAYDEALETLTELLSDPNIDPEVKDHYQDLIDEIAETVVDDEGERFKEPGTEEEIAAVVDATQELNDLIAELDKDNDGELDDEFKKDLDAYEDYDDALETLTELLNDPDIDPEVKEEIEAEIAEIAATVVDEDGERFKETGDEAVDAANTEIVENATDALQEIIDRLDSDHDGELDDQFKQDLDEYAAYDEALAKVLDLIDVPNIDPEIKAEVLEQLESIAAMVVDEEGERFKKPGTEEEINAVITATGYLNDIINELDANHDGKLDDEFKTTLTVDTSVLEAAVAEATALAGHTELYTEATLSALQAALAEAEAVLTANTGFTTKDYDVYTEHQNAVNQAAADLNTKIGALVKKDAEEYEDYNEALEDLKELLEDPAISPEAAQEIKDIIDAAEELAHDENGDTYKIDASDEDKQKIVDATQDLIDAFHQYADEDGNLKDEYKINESQKNRRIQFVVGGDMCYLVHLDTCDYYIMRADTPEIRWYTTRALRFEVQTFGNWGRNGYIVAVNGVLLEPNADGSYTIPAGTEYVKINCSAKDVPTATGTVGTCGWCGKIHPNTLWGRIIWFFHQIFLFFRNLFRR